MKGGKDGNYDRTERRGFADFSVAVLLLLF